MRRGRSAIIPSHRAGTLPRSAKVPPTRKFADLFRGPQSTDWEIIVPAKFALRAESLSASPRSPNPCAEEAKRWPIMFDQIPVPENGVDRSPVIACITMAPGKQAVAEAASQLAAQTGMPLILFHAIENRPAAGHLPDPIASYLDRSRMRECLGDLGRKLASAETEIDIALCEGNWSGALASLATARHAPIVVVGSSHGADSSHLAADLLERGIPNILFVPDRQEPSLAATAPRRILVPLDGSAFAEAALAEAIALASSGDAELLLAHAIPVSGIDEFGPPVTGDSELRTQIDQRNDEAAREFLEARIRRIHALGIPVRSRCLMGDPRTTLARLIAEEQPAMLVMSARGHGIRNCQDLAVGSTASYLLDHIATPLLLVAATSTPLHDTGEPLRGQRRSQRMRGPLNRPPVPVS